METSKILIELPSRQMERLRDIAKYQGFVLDRSQRKGEGNVRQLLAAIAEGRLVLYPKVQSNGKP